MKVELEEGDWREVEDLRVVDLRALLGKFELSKTGTKPVLIKRLEAHLSEIGGKEEEENVVEETPEEILDEANDESKASEAKDSVNEGQAERERREPREAHKKQDEKLGTEGGKESSPSSAYIKSQDKVETKSSSITDVKEPQSASEPESNPITTQEKPQIESKTQTNVDVETPQPKSDTKSTPSCTPKDSQPVVGPKSSPMKSQKKPKPSVQESRSDPMHVREEDAPLVPSEEMDSMLVIPSGDSPLVLETDDNEFKEEEEEAVRKERRVSSEEDKSEQKAVSRQKSPSSSKKRNPSIQKLPSTEKNVDIKEDEQKNEQVEQVDSTSSTPPPPPPKPSIPFRKLNKSTSKEDRKPRPWSDSSSTPQEQEQESLGAVSMGSLKDIIPDMKTILEGSEEMDCTTQEKETKEDDKTEEKESPKRKDENQMKETSQDCEDGVASKRPRIDAPPLKEEEGDDENKSDVLLIRNLVRPFTLKQLKELLERTGTLEDFWINKIKSHCLVRFSSASEAGETRRALDDVKWPSSNPKRLSVTFSSREKMEETVKESSSFQAPKKVDGDPPKAAESKDVNKSKEGGGQQTKPQVLDDLFRKTKVRPFIYWTLNEKSLKRLKEENKKVDAS